MRSLILVLILMSGCVNSQAVACDDGRTCPANSVCDDTHLLCVSSDQVSSCVGQTAGAACTAGSIVGFCTDGICLPMVCGDKIIEGDESCDDGNHVDGDGCSSNCKSDEKCGNNVIDVITGEQCDDGNHLDHDGCSSACRTEAPHWIRHTLEPTARWETSGAYDSRRDAIVVFGGQDSTSSPLGDTLEWNGADWVVATPSTSPAPRLDAGMAYDRDHGNTVLFGGRLVTSQAFGDTWLWDGVAWTAPDITQAPPPRYAMGTAYDPRRHVVVVFGGTNGGGTGTSYFSDTWEWDGTTWTQNTSMPHPSAREYGSMTYDPKLGMIVLTGGDVLGGDTSSTNNTWTYDGTWHDVTSGTNPSITQAMMAYDLTSQRVVLFGGYSGSPQSAVWTWNETTWTNLGTISTGTSPGARRTGVLASTSTKLVVFGGAFPTSPPPLDTYFLKLSPNGWSQPTTLSPRTGLGVVNDPIHRTALVVGGETDLGTGATLGDTYVLSTAGLTPHAAGPSARAFASLAFDYTSRNIVLFGGTTNPVAAGNNSVGDTWIWNTSAWTSQSPTLIPPGRYNAAIAFDGAAVAMVGGLQTTMFSSSLSDAFTWHGTSWSAAPSLTPAAPVTVAATGYDPIRAELVTFGGLDGAGAAITSTKTYDGTTLTTQPAAFPASERDGATLSWNPARRRLTLVGGKSSKLEAFEWDGTAWHVVEAANAPTPRTGHGGMTSLDGTGVTIIGGSVPSGGTSTLSDDRWELRWDGPRVAERCDGSDLDGDGLVGCADPDCWPICAPLCPPGVTCDPTAPVCGDGVCVGDRESCSTCPQDCNPCAPVCGNGICDPGETGCPGDCP